MYKCIYIYIYTYIYVNQITRSPPLENSLNSQRSHTDFCATATWESATYQNSNISDLDHSERMLRSLEGPTRQLLAIAPHSSKRRYQKRSSPRTKRESGDKLKVLDRTCRGVRMDFDRILEGSITPKGSESRSALSTLGAGEG